MSKFEESSFYKALQDFFINADKKTFLQFLAEFYNRTEGIIDKNNIQDELIKELRDLYLEFNEKGIDENIVREKVNYFVENNVKIKNISSKLDNVINYTESIEYNLVNIGFKFDGSDESELFQSLMPTSSEKRVTIIMPHNKSLKVKNIHFNGTLLIKGNFCRFLGDNPTDIVFVTNTKEDMSVLYAENLYFKNICFAKFHMDGDFPSTRRIYARNIWADSMNQTGKLIDCRSCDFVNLENVQAYSYDTIIHINSEFNKVPSDRMNTQIRLKNISGGQCNYGIYLNGVDKLTIDGVDFGKIKTGLIINMWTRRMNIKNYHCETYGYYECTENFDGYGIYIGNRQYNIENTIEESSLFLPSTYARGGIYMANDNANSVNTNQFIFRNVEIDNKENDDTFVKLTLRGNYKWIGNIDYNNNSKIDLGGVGSSNTLLNGCIEPTKYNYVSRNLLSIDKIIGVESFSSVSGELSVTTNDDIINFENTTNAAIDCILKFKPKSIGWYTLLFNGNLKSTSNLITIMLNNPPYTTVFSSSCVPHYNYSTNKIYFYVSSLVEHRIQFKISKNSRIELNGDIGLYKGFKNGF